MRNIIIGSICILVGWLGVAVLNNQFDALFHGIAWTLIIIGGIVVVYSWLK